MTYTLNYFAKIKFASKLIIFPILLTLFYPIYFLHKFITSLNLRFTLIDGNNFCSILGLSSRDLILNWNLITVKSKIIKIKI